MLLNMARLLNTDDDTSIILPSRCVIGRSRVCQLRLSALEASGEHALIRWQNGLWEVLDLSSRNGTFCDGKVLGPGQRAPIIEGSRLGFGRPKGYVLAEDDAPEPFAVDVESRNVVEPEHGLLLLPGATDPEVAILYRDERWWKEDADGLAPISDGEFITTSVGRWRLSLPEKLTPTGHAKETPLTLATTTLSLTKVPNRGVQLIIKRAATRIDLGVRAHHLPLFLLVRARLRDRALRSDSQGWVRQDELVRELRCDRGRLNVDIHRLRRLLAKAGIIDAAQVIERRPQKKILRVGSSNIEIVAAGPEDHSAVP